MQETIAFLRQQLGSFMSNKNSSADSTTTRVNSYEDSLEIKYGRGSEFNSCDEISLDENTPTSVRSSNRLLFSHANAKDCNCDAQLLAQVGILVLCSFLVDVEISYHR